MAYPTSLDELTDGVPSDVDAPSTALDNATYPHDDHHRALAVAVEAVEAELGTDPSGASATVAARFTATETVANAAAAKASNLSDLASASSARTNLGLGGAAVLSVGTTAGSVAAGDDSRLTDARTPTAHAASHAGAGSDPITALGPVTVLTTGAAVVPLIAKGRSAQTANLQEWQNSAGTVLARMTPTNGIESFDSVGFGARLGGARAATTYGLVSLSNAPYSGFAYLDFYDECRFVGFGTSEVMRMKGSGDNTLVMATAAANYPLAVKGYSAQTANLTEWRNSAGTALASVTAAGLHKWASGNEQTTVGAAGAASALPASPTKYLKVVGSDGTTYAIAAYLAA